jgi:hypothetical protein
MANSSSNYGLRSGRHTGSGEVARTPATCEDGPSSANEPFHCTDKAMIAKLVGNQLLEHFGKPEARKCTPDEQIISRRLANTVIQAIEGEFFKSMDIVIETSIDENELLDDFGSNVDPDFEPLAKKPVFDREGVSREIMQKAVMAYNSAKKNKLIAAQRISKKAKYPMTIKRWETYLNKGGTTQNKMEIIKQHMWSQFQHYRQQLKATLHDRDLKMWAIDKAFDVGLPEFKACSTFIQDFKHSHNIRSRKVTHTVTKVNLFPELSLQPIIDEFRKDFATFINQNNCAMTSILNTDQSGFEYEIVSKRTLDMKGSRNVDASIISKNKTTHSYTVQMTINAGGKFVGPLLIVTQESEGVFGPIVKKRLQELSNPNILIRCSKSGKTSKEITGEYFEKVKESLNDDKIILLMDSWSGQTDKTLWKQKMGDNVEFMYFPPGTTKYLQPLDVNFFQYYKYFIKKTVEYSKTHRILCGDVDITTRENIILLHRLAYNQFSSPTFDDMRRYAFQKAIIKQIDPVFRSVKHTCFRFTHKTCSNCTKLTFMVCAWCWKHLCFTHFYTETHIHDY